MSHIDSDGEEENNEQNEIATESVLVHSHE